MSAVHLANPTAIDARWDELVEEIPFGLVLHDHLGTVVATNTKAADLLDLHPDQLRAGTHPADWRLCDDAGAPLPRMAELAGQTARAGAPTTVAFVLTRGTLPFRRLWADLHPVTCRGQRMALLVLRPVEAEPLRGLLDPTTGLPHRALLFDRIEQSLARARVHGTRMTLVLADVRALGAINAKHGFDHGDELLTRLAARLRRDLREDQTVARYTGGTFAVVTEHPGGSGDAIAEQVRAAAEVPTRVNRRLVHPTLRLGWVSSDGGSTVHQLISEAETRLAGS
ncbi:diguanylate cyclase/phosphodiesterase (GGDEF & EAL domains) with PAS/PAC sensor(s) [Alloactinosynnema sp. L-07]|uniref:sensor domain-containing diguanylate cyclase n=1 Tax=Alloactinosynnema sp. L-07 TaxID=1653480 RepID=UPI00065EF7E4|nr:sensor domain-containing diguanylate cyclase [Alloactinosynnema sp. L-07]CRK60664.1 diguanylate cyclase/phosphodiesterase (GGDEF & EAL domains) with PAS/PAC sensor(s) [Alloactinosynnema sp. L-07]